MRIDDDPNEEPRKDDSGSFEDAIEPPEERSRESSWASRFRCFRRNPRDRGVERPQRGRSRERSVRDGTSQTPEPNRRDGRSQPDPRPTTSNSQTATVPRPLARQRGVSRTNIERTPRREAGTAIVPWNLNRQRGVSGIDIARTPWREAESQAAIAPERRATGSQASNSATPSLWEPELEQQTNH